jgi:aryl-alcohol dehydrogenase-like predicted oxidoreductase
MLFLRTARSIPLTIERRLEALGEYPIDLYQLHNPYSFSSLEAQLREMVSLVRSGKIQAIEGNGILEGARRPGATIIAYSPLAQGLLAGAYQDDPRRILDFPGIRKHLKAFRPEELERIRPLIEELSRIGAAHEATPAEVTLSWLINAHGDTVAAIPGATLTAQAA